GLPLRKKLVVLRPELTELTSFAADAPARLGCKGRELREVQVRQALPPLRPLLLLVLLKRLAGLCSSHGCSRNQDGMPGHIVHVVRVQDSLERLTHDTARIRMRNQRLLDEVERGVILENPCSPSPHFYLPFAPTRRLTRRRLLRTAPANPGRSTKRVRRWPAGRTRRHSAALVERQHHEPREVLQHEVSEAVQACPVRDPKVQRVTYRSGA